MKPLVTTRKSLRNIAMLISFTFFTGYASAQTDDHSKTITETPANCFVQLNDGSIQQYTSLKLVTGVLVTPHLLADNKTVISTKDIKAYSNDKHFAVSDKSLTTKKTALVATETLPGFAIRIVSGKINVYSRKYYNGGTTVNEYFLQQGNDGPITAYSKDVMKSFIKDNPKALDYYNSKLKISPESKKLLVAADIYNTGELISKN